MPSVTRLWYHADKCVREVGISNNKYEVVYREWYKLDVEQAAHGGAEFVQF